MIYYPKMCNAEEGSHGIRMKTRHMHGLGALLLLSWTVLLTGCEGFSGSDMTQKASKEEEMVSLGLTPEFDYEVPKSFPDIMVNRRGYAADSSKIAVFRGEMLPDTYDILDAGTKEVVYTGNIDQKGYDRTTEEMISYGDFTDFVTSGVYYIQAEVVGQSYPFVIEQDPYAKILDDALKQYYYSRCGLTLSGELAGDAAHSACHTKNVQLQDDAGTQLDVSGGWHVDGKGTRSVEAGCHGVNNLLLAYELYGDIYTDRTNIPESGNEVPDIIDEVKYEIDWLLKMQDASSGAVYSAVSIIDSDTAYLSYIEPVTMPATIQFAATVAKFSYLYQNFDRDFATQCLKAADRAYRYAEAYLTDVATEEYFHAATELYRATGNQRYHSAIVQYLKTEGSPDFDNNHAFWGCVTYLSTKQSVNVDLCEEAISVLLKEGEEISFASKESEYLTEGNKEQDNIGELLQKMVRLAVVDHIITNHEYMTVLENYMHYFLGRNPQSVSYIGQTADGVQEAAGERMNIMKQIDQNAEWILLMSAIEEELASR